VLAVWIYDMGELPRSDAFTDPGSYIEVARIAFQLPEVCPHEVGDDIIANYTGDAS